MSFKQQVVLALLNGDMEKWMVQFDDVEGAAQYISAELPDEGDVSGIIGLQQQVIAVQVAELAEAIVKAVGDG